MGDIIILHQYTKNPDDIIYSFWDIEYHKLILAIMSHFLLFYPPKTPKNQIVKKWKNCRIYFTHVHQISHPYDVRFLKFGVRWRNFFSIWAIFCPSLLPLLFTRKIKILKRWKGDPGDVIILHIFIWNENYMMYGSWDMEREARIFCHFRPAFTLLLPPNPKQPVIKTINWWIKKSNWLVILFLMEKV